MTPDSLHQFIYKHHANFYISFFWDLSKDRVTTNKLSGRKGIDTFTLKEATALQKIISVAYNNQSIRIHIELE